ncbi:putative allantoin permease [Rhizodiscina lignyota]|uniref:Allantoin permease n=1 Tax=Rhizodiscina lignyota TaxID=1504668 RepID=A0A9P4M6W2_9PEZI|nr:putative allantoin permease [Rhizodiscina lignyota]
MGFLGRVDSFLRTKESRFRDINETNQKWGNEDLDPTGPSQRTWISWSYFAFFWAVSFNPVQWNTGASLVNQGLLWWQALLSILVGNLFTATCLVLNSRAAAVYHIGMPVYMRVSAGYYLSFFFIFIRGSVAIIYCATQNYYAGRMMDVLLRAAFGHNWTDLPNHLPASAGITSPQMGAFWIFFVIQFPFMFIHPHNQKWFYYLKSFIAPPVMVGIFGFMVGKNHGLTGAIALTKPVSSSAQGWAFMAGINSVAGSVVTEIVSNPDLARYAKKPSAAGWPQGLAIFMSKSFVIFMGIASSAAARTMYGTAYWNPWDLFDAILDHNWDAGARTAIFLASVVQIFAIIATNLASNCVPTASDLTGLFPRYFNLKRGQVFCVVLSLACVPWKIIASAQSFLTFLGSYVCFLGPILAITITDYFIIRKGNIHIPSVYNGSTSSPYWYWHGFNWRMAIAWIAGFAITIHGLAGSYNIHFSQVSKHMYSLGFPLATTTSAVFYYTLNRIWPVPIYPPEREGEVKSFEALGKTDGFFDDEVSPEEVVPVIIDGVDGIESGPFDYDSKMAHSKEVNF